MRSYGFRERRGLVRRLLGLWLIGAVIWVGVTAVAVHPEHFLRRPLYVWQDLTWQFADCQHLPAPPGASPADLMVPRVLCSRAQRSGMRRHLVLMFAPPFLVLGLGLYIAWVGRILASER